MSSCPICLEPFFPSRRAHSTEDAVNNNNVNNNDDEDKALGAVDPCGHIFHFHCFALWKANAGSRCKCPECNQPAKKCIKLFGIAPPEEGWGHEDEDDDGSSFSSEEDDELNSEEMPPPANNNRLCNEEDDDDQSVEVVEVIATGPWRNVGYPQEVVDMTRPTPRRPPHQPSPVNKQTSDGVNKYKRAAKKYKGLFKQKDSQCRELNLQRQSLIDLHSSTSQENKELHAKMEAWQEQSELRNAQLDAAHLKVIRLSNEFERIQGQVHEIIRQRDSWNTKHDELQRSFKKEVQRVKTSDMAEVQQMMEERHKLLADNERLVREHAAAVLRESKLRAIIRPAASSQMAKRTSPAATTSNAKTNNLSRVMLSLTASAPDKKRKASSIAKALRVMDHARFPNVATDRRAGFEAVTSFSPPANKMSARSSSLMINVRQERQLQKGIVGAGAAGAAQKGERSSNFMSSSLLSDGTSTRILQESVRRTSMDSAEQQHHTGLRPNATSLGLKISSTKHALFKRR